MSRTIYFLKDGRTIKQYCNEVKEHPPYKTIMYRICQLGWMPDDAVSIPSRNNIRPVHGMSFKKYCESHGLPYIKLHIAWRKLTKYNKRFRKENITAEEFIDNYVNGVKYEWDLSEIYDKHYCIKKGLNYNNTYSYWSSYKRDQYSFKDWVDYRVKVKNSTDLEDIPPKTYCRIKGYKYHKLYSQYRRKGFKTFKDYLKHLEKNNGNSSETS